MAPPSDAGDTHGEPVPASENRRHTIVATIGASLAVVLAVIAIVAAYVISLRSSPGEQGSPTTPALQRTAYPAPTLSGVFPPEPGPDGQEWQWLGSKATLTLNDRQPGWLAFRALSLSRPRILSVRSPSGQRFAARIGTRAQIVVIGPLASGAMILRPHPSGMIASPRDHRRLSIFLSMLRVFAGPVVALPGEGFWPTEGGSGLPFNWMGGHGVIDVYDARARVSSVWLTFDAASIGEVRTLVAQSGRSRERILVPIVSRLVELGPFRLSKGRARILLRTSPGAARYGGDLRLLSVRVAELAVRSSPSEM